MAVKNANKLGRHKCLVNMPVVNGKPRGMVIDGEIKYRGEECHPLDVGFTAMALQDGSLIKADSDEATKLQAVVKAEKAAAKKAAAAKEASGAGLLDVKAELEAAEITNLKLKLDALKAENKELIDKAKK